ncbi:hypothetical protein D3C72_1927870 [compost metagenome]
MAQRGRADRLLSKKGPKPISLPENTRFVTVSMSPIGRVAVSEPIIMRVSMFSMLPARMLLAMMEKDMANVQATACMIVQ